MVGPADGVAGAIGHHPCFETGTDPDVAAQTMRIPQIQEDIEVTENTTEKRAQAMAVAASTEKKTAKKAPPKKASSKSTAAKTMKEAKDPAERSAAAKTLSDGSGGAKKAPAKKSAPAKADGGMTQADVGTKIAATSKSAKGKATGKAVEAEAKTPAKPAAKPAASKAAPKKVAAAPKGDAPAASKTPSRAKKSDGGMTQADVGAKIAATSKSAKGKATGKKVMQDAAERETKPEPELPTEPVEQQDNGQLGITMQKSSDPAVRSAAAKKMGASGAAKPKKAPAKKAAPKK